MRGRRNAYIVFAHDANGFLTHFVGQPIQRFGVLHHLFTHTDGEISQILADASAKDGFKTTTAANFGLYRLDIFELLQGSFQFFYLGIGFHHARTCRQRDSNIDGGFANAGNKALRELPQQEQTASKDEGGNQHGDKAML